MRDIKFRAWDKVLGMVQVIKISGSGSWFEVSHDNVTDFYTLDRDGANLMQYTGLKDKNGVEIYEGDILQRIWSDKSILQQFTVKWLEENTGYNISKQLLESTRYNRQTGLKAHGFKIIGNIYKNPELLKGEK